MLVPCSHTTSSLPSTRSWCKAGLENQLHILRSSPPVPLGTTLEKLYLWLELDCSGEARRGLLSSKGSDRQVLGKQSRRYRSRLSSALGLLAKQGKTQARSKKLYEWGLWDDPWLLGEFRKPIPCLTSFPWTPITWPRLSTVALPIS